MLQPSRHLALAFFVGALAAAFWRAPTSAASGFSLPPATQTAPLAAQFVSEMLPQAGTSADHPTLTELADGRVAAAWQAGNDDEHTIHFSVLDRDGWRQAVPIASRASTAGGAFAYVGSIGQPVLHAEGSWLHLWYVSRALGSSINHSVSTDGGKHWTKPNRLQTSPFANMGGEVGAAPVPLADGGLGLPIGHSFPGRHGEWLRLAPTGVIVGKLRLPGSAGGQSPAVAALEPLSALAVWGDAASVSGMWRQATTSDGGQHWQADDIPAGAVPASAVALLRLKSGRLLLAGNPAGSQPGLQLWLSADQGKHWQPGRMVESAPDGGARFANPALLLGRDGRIHLAYAWRQQGIKHVVFSEAWVDGGQP